MSCKVVLNSLLVLAVMTPVLGQNQGPMPEQAPPSLITINDALSIAIQNNPGLAIARNSVDKSRNQIDEAAGQGKIQASLAATYAGIFPGPTSFALTPTGLQEVTLSSGRFTGNATVLQPIDISRQITIGKRLATQRLNIQTFSEEQTLQQLIFNVKNAYYSVLRAEANVNVAQSSLTAAQDRLHLASLQFDAGVVPKFDVTKAEVDVANFEQTLIQSQSAVQVARGALNTVLGVDVNNPYTVEEQKVPVSPVTVDITARTKEAIVARPEVKQAYATIQANNTNVLFTEKNTSPKLNLFASADALNNNVLISLSDFVYTLGARLTWPIWDGGITRARVREAKDDVNISKNSFEQAVLLVEFDVRTAALNLMDASKRVGTAQANVTLAQDALNLARVRYEAGVATEVEVSNAEAALTQALTNEVSARYDYLTAEAQLQKATASQPEYSTLAKVPGPSVVGLQGEKTK